MKKVLGLLSVILLVSCSNDSEPISTDTQKYVTDSSFKYRVTSETQIYDFTNDGVFNPTEKDLYPISDKYYTDYYAVANYSFFDKEKMILDDKEHGTWDGGDNLQVFVKVISSDKGILKLESGEKADFTLKNQFTVKIIEQGMADGKTYYGFLSTTFYKLIP
jgi:hypothetical protein